VNLVVQKISVDKLYDTTTKMGQRTLCDRATAVEEQKTQKQQQRRWPKQRTQNYYYVCRLVTMSK